MSLEDDFKFMREYLVTTECSTDVELTFERIAEAMQGASAILIRARHVCQVMIIHDGSMEASVTRDIDEWRKKQRLER